MILGDTDVLSAMAKISRLPLLFSLLAADKLYVVPGVVAELEHSFSLGRQYATDLFAFLTAGRIEIVYLTPEEAVIREGFPITLGAGERESVAVALQRGGTVLSNESRVAHVCREQGVACIRIPDILRASWVEGLASKQEVQEIVADLKAEDRMLFKRTVLDAVFSE